MVVTAGVAQSRRSAGLPESDSEGSRARENIAL